MGRLRSGLAVLATGCFVVAALLVPLVPGTAFEPPPVLAGDVKCDANPEACGTLTVRLTGPGKGDAFAGPEGGADDGYISCHRINGLTEGTCSAMYYVPIGSRTVWVTGDAGDDTTACIDTTECAPGFVYGYVTLTAGSRASKTVDFSWTNPVTVTVQKTGTGTGTVDSKPVGISCGSICTAVWPAGIMAQIAANPTGGSTLQGITIGGVSCIVDDTCLFLVEDDTTVVVQFNAAATPAPTPGKTPSPTSTKAPTPAPTGLPTVRPPTAAPGGPTAAPPSGAASLPPVVIGSAPPSPPDAATAGPTPTDGEGGGTLPPIATRPPTASADPAVGAGDLTPWLLVILVTIVVTGGFLLLGRVRGKGGA